MQNGFIESFNGRLRDECLNEHLFPNLKEARQIIEEWRIDYNTTDRTRASTGSHRLSSQHAPPRGLTGTDSPYKRGQLGEQVKRDACSAVSAAIMKSATSHGFGKNTRSGG